MKYSIKIRNQESIILDGREGEEFKKLWLSDELPKIIEIKNLTFKVGDILSVREIAEENNKKICQLSDTELKEIAKPFYNALINAKKIPYSENEYQNDENYSCYPSIVSHTFFVSGYTVKNEDRIIISCENKSIKGYLEFERSFQAFWDLNLRKNSKPLRNISDIDWKKIREFEKNFGNI